MLRDFFFLFLSCSGTLSKQQMGSSELSSVSGLRQRYVCTRLGSVPVSRRTPRTGPAELP